MIVIQAIGNTQQRASDCEIAPNIILGIKDNVWRFVLVDLMRQQATSS